MNGGGEQLEYWECLECGAFFQNQSAGSRKTLAARGHMPAPQCDEAEYARACPLCDSFDIGVAIFDARDCVRAMAAAFPQQHVKVQTVSRSSGRIPLAVWLWIDDRQYGPFWAKHDEERLGRVFRRGMARLLARCKRSGAKPNNL